MSLQGNTSNYTTVINAWREWKWQGSMPLNSRLGRFISLAKMETLYNITFAAMPPLQLNFQIQQSGGTGGDWLMAKIYYPLPNSVQVLANGVVMPPVILTDTSLAGIHREINSSLCGDNIFYFSNRTIQFVLLDDSDC